jgi:hypothetical protein
MSGYRQRDLDLNGGGDTGPPLRPYNWVQWSGVALALVGIGIDLVYLAGRAGLTPRLLDSPSVGIALPLVGAALINSRRQPGQPSDPEALGRRRTLAFTVAGAAFVVGLVVAILLSKGA